MLVIKLVDSQKQEEHYNRSLQDISSSTIRKHKQQHSKHIICSSEQLNQALVETLYKDKNKQRQVLEKSPPLHNLKPNTTQTNFLFRKYLYAVSPLTHFTAEQWYYYTYPQWIATHHKMVINNSLLYISLGLLHH